MADLTPFITTFAEKIKNQEQLLGLQSSTDNGWLVCDSVEYEQTEVMPLWSDEALAASHCCDEWAEFKPVAIPLEDFLEYWIEDLNEDGVLLGLDWDAKENCPEVDPIDLAKFLLYSDADK